MGELDCPECGKAVAVGEFPVLEGTLARCAACKTLCCVMVDSSDEWVSPSGESHGRAFLVTQEEDDE